MSLPTRILLTALLNVLLVWALDRYLDTYFIVTGGIPAYVVIGSLLTLMNILVRPILHLVTLPLKLLATILAIIIVNGVFLWLTLTIVDMMDDKIVKLTITGGVAAWLLLAVILGMSNWLMKEILRARKHREQAPVEPRSEE